jgi:2'-5' RNA ligase
VEETFNLELRDWGGFPNLRNPRVVWCGISGDRARLEALQQKVEETCRTLGFTPEERRYHPHLTLGRVKSKRALHPLLDCIKMGCDLAHPFEVSGFNVYKSTLSPKGATYEVKERIPLRSAT